MATVFFYNPTAGKVRFEIHSLQGQAVVSENSYFAEGEQQYELNFGGLAKGFYLLRLEGENCRFEPLKLLVK